MTTPNTVTVPALQFASLLAPVMPLASKDGTLPILNAVLIERRGPYLVAIATDRYRVGIKRIKVLGDSDFRALVRIADLRRILTIFKSPKRGDTDLSLTVLTDPIAVNADYLAEFRHAASAAEPLRMWTVEAENKRGHDYATVCVQAGDFLGLLMTIRQSEGSTPLARDDTAWADLLGTSTPATADAA